MARIARFLPLVAVAAWSITLVLPILDSGDSHGGGIVVTSLGESVSTTAVHPAFLLAWGAVLGCAASVWLFRSLTWWGVVTIVAAIALSAFFVSVLLDPPSLIWDGVDAQGRPIGGYEVARPAIGALLWAAGIAALFGSGVCGLIGATREGGHRE